MYEDGKLWIANSGENKICILPKMANRHGLIAGATGTGKTVTLRAIAQSFSEAGVPVFLADVKGDLASICHVCPVTFWDLYGQKGLPLRTTISEMGPTLLARLMGLTKLQEDILSVIFRIADEQGLLLLDTKDLRSMVNHVTENNKEYSEIYGNMSKASLNVILRAVLALEEQGGETFFGEPALDIFDWICTAQEGKGMVNILDSSTLINEPKIYAMFLLWMLSELFETLPEVGDPEKPKMVFFFDEAHLLFSDAPKALVTKIEQVVKLVRSKGVGVYFITQNPSDIPSGVLAQLGNKVQHALHAYTPEEQKGIKAAANSFRSNPAFDTREALEQLGIGEALISFLQADGSPMMVERAKVMLPEGDLGPISDSEREKEVKKAGLRLNHKYDEMIDRDSAYEFLERRRLQIEEEEAEKAAEAEKAKQAALAEKERQKEEERLQKEKEKEEARIQKEKEKEEAAAKKKKTQIVSSVASTTGGTVGREVGNAIGKTFGGNLGKKIGGNVGAALGRGILGSLFKK